MGLFSKIKEGLKKTRKAVMGQIESMLKSFTKIDEELFEELEELLVMGDVGVPTAEKIAGRLFAIPRRKCYDIIIQSSMKRREYHEFISHRSGGDPVHARGHQRGERGHPERPRRPLRKRDRARR